MGDVVANLQHLEQLQQGVQRWNQWRRNNPRIRPDLSGATLLIAQLSGANLSQTKLRRVRLEHAELSGANLYKAELSGADLTEANLNGAKLRKARLRGIKLGRTELQGANLSKASLPESDLSGANLSGANLRGANLCRANLSGANLTGADLSEAWLVDTKVLGTVFSKALFTGACIQGWNPNRATILEGVICDYVFLKDFQKERHPKDRTFRPGEFARAFQHATGIFELVFKGRIDWQAFCRSFQNLCEQYAAANLSIQAIERRQGGVFVIRLEMSPDTNAVTIERRAKELYMAEMRALDVQYKQWLRSHGYPLDVARLSINMERRDKATLMGILTTMAYSQQGPKYQNALNGPAKLAKQPPNGHAHQAANQTGSLKKLEPIQIKIIEMLLAGISPATITQLMRLESGQLSFYQRQPAFRQTYWRVFLNKMLELTRLLMTTLKKLVDDIQLRLKYCLWLMRRWLACFSAAMDYQGPPDIPVLQSEIIHLLLLGMTPGEVGNALMIEPQQIDRYRQRPAFRVAFWYAYCQKLLTLIDKATNTVRAIGTNRQIPPRYCLLAADCLLEKLPTDFTRTLERMEVEQMACVLMAIGAGQISYSSSAF